MDISRAALAVLMTFWLAGCCGNRPAAEPVPGASAVDANTAALHALFDKEWERRLQEDPLYATYVGRAEYNGELPSATEESERRRADFARDMLADLEAVDRDALGDQDRISHDLFADEMRKRISDFEFGHYQMPFTSDTGFHLAFAQLPSAMPFETAADYENYLSRLRAWPQLVDEVIGVMRVGLERGMTLPKTILSDFDQSLQPLIAEEPEGSLFYAPFLRFPEAVAEADRARLAEAGKAGVMDGAVAGYRSFLKFMVEEYVPGARESLGASELPNGAAYYDKLVKEFTTLDVDAEQVHQIGLKEVARIRAEMQAIIERVGFEGDFAAFLKHLRTDPKFYAKTPEELLQRAAYICKRMDAKLPSLFKTLPRLPYGVEPVPDHIAPRYTGGRYVGPAEGGSEPGYYWVNTYALDTRPLYTQEALSLHEAVPGHHLQNAIARELTDLPPFRRYTYLSAFGEGWGLYSEFLGIEAGFYTDPYSDFGRLTYEMWRACRLVVDTGIHAKGWGRQQVIDYLASHTALSIHECTTETDRYISWPGQALSYKMGEIKIKELRRRAEERLGAAFDVREFHDEVLKNGSVPLKALEDQIDRYIARQRQAGP